MGLSLVLVIALLGLQSVIVSFPDQMHCCIFLFCFDLQRKDDQIPMEHRCNNQSKCY